MSRMINIHEAKTNFSKIINLALKGEEIVIARNGHPVIKLTPYSEELTPRVGGQLKGMIEIADDFDAPLSDEVLKGFYGEDLP